MSTAVCVAQIHDVVCSDGNGSFHGEFRTGVSVQVRAARIGELANRSCEATLTWDKGSLKIAADAPQIDVDAFGVDLGLGMPVAAFQVKHAGNECCMDYQVYSLEKPPRLLRSIRGGDFFSASDTDLDDRPAIWTHDAAAVEGFEHLTLPELDSAPSIVLRFQQGQLVDASSEFQPYFDTEISRLRKALDSGDLRDFKNSDGKLSFDVSIPVERLHRLRGVKAKILEIVWGYLYSGREEQAWRELTSMWPAADLARIHVAIVDARARGIRTQVDGVSQVRGKKPKRRQIFDAIHESDPGKLEVTPPSPIMLRRPPPSKTSSKDVLQSELLWELIIDSVGKVRSVEPVGRTHSVDRSLVQAAYDWKFVPAFKNGKPVASRIHLADSVKQ